MADVVDDDGDRRAVTTPWWWGPSACRRNSRRLRLPDTPAGRAAQLARDDDDDESPPARRLRRRVLILTALGMLLLGLVVGAGVGWYTWSQGQYFVATTPGTTGDVVAVFRGPTEPLFGLDLSRLVETSTVGVAELPEFEQEQVASRTSSPRTSTTPARSSSGCDRGRNAAPRRTRRPGCPESP